MIPSRGALGMAKRWAQGRVGGDFKAQDLGSSAGPEPPLSPWPKNRSSVAQLIPGGRRPVFRNIFKPVV